MLSCTFRSVSSRSLYAGVPLTGTQRCNSYAAKAAPADLKKFEPKLKVSGDGAELATYLFTLASKNNEREKVLNQLNQMKAKFKEDMDFWALFRTNTVKDEHLKAIKFSDSLYEAMTVGKQKQQLQHMAKVMKFYNDMVEAEPKDLTAIVTVPSPMSPAELAKFDKDIRRDFPDVCGNNNITVKEKIDPYLLEGYTLQIANLYVDNSGKRNMAVFEEYVDRTVNEFYDSQMDAVLRHRGWPA